MEHNLKKKIFLGLASITLSIGFLISIVDGYYVYNYYHFIDIGRKDLTARLGFLSLTTGFIYYPILIVVLALTSYFLKRTKKELIKRQWLYMIGPAFLIGIIFYTHSIDFLLMEYIRFWKIGLILMLSSILTFIILIKGKQIKNKKTEHNNS